MANNRRRSRHSRENTSSRNRKKDVNKFDDQRDVQGRPDQREDRGTNDMSWYNKNPELLIAAGQFPFPYRPGMVIKGMGINNAPAQGQESIADFAIPGVLTLNWFPYVGKSSTAMTPASVVAKQMYAKVRAAFSGELTVDAPDLLMYQMALDSIFAYIAFLKRTYRTLNAYSVNNRITPDGLLKAYGFSETWIQSLRENKILFWQLINQLVLQSRKFTCPANMDIFNRHYWMSDNVYTDSNSINSQFYVFTPSKVYKFAELPVVDQPAIMASGLKYTSTIPTLSPGQNGAVELYNVGLSLIEALVTWDEAYTINGYLMRAYSEYPTFMVEELRADEMLTPMYNEEVLMQIENSRCIGAFVDPTSMNVTQDPNTNAVVCPNNVKLLTSVVNVRVEPTLTIRSDMPTVGDSVVSSRLQTFVDPIGDDVLTDVCRIYAGTEVVEMFQLLLPTYAGMGEVSWTPNVLASIWLGGPTATASQLSTLAYLEAFDWHPLVHCLMAHEVTPFMAVFGDVHNTTKIELNDLENLNEVCLYSEFGSFNQ